ncbi:filamentous hemagglutinin N-terminal domain-containing protein [Limnohabitans sp. DM1]|uniref:filamentous hemagglutinin N-terminal domain-containing protein n=1 Tax=Limnohabitans sp. DM1 TaxID=1597955 RepID=UPI000A4229FC|nr:filamentous hemagglutinin N-terminal domain-containing protein [Limnohabitans sp. DM1]
MNKRCFKTIFSKHLGVLVAVGEHAASQGKAIGHCAGTGFDKGFSLATVYYIGALTLSFALVSMAWAAPANNALPTGGQVAQGAAAISQSGANMGIHQSTARAVVNWQSFDIGKDAKVNIVQPNAQAVLLNRVNGPAPSQIFGQMTANGQVVLVNPNGVTFGKDGSVSAAGLTASTLNTTDADFMAGRNRFTRDGATGQVINQGTLTSAPGGYVALLGASVSNEGKIVAPQGNVALGAAETITLPLYGSRRIKMELTPSAINAAVANQKGGSIVTEGGQVYMQAAAVGSAIASVMQSGGIDTTGAQGGAVHLLAEAGRIKVDGSITANSTQGSVGGDIYIGRDKDTNVLAKTADVSGALLESQGGFVETSGQHLKVDGVRVMAKDWLLDPYNINIVGSGPTGTAYTDGDSATPGVQFVPGATSNILAGDIVNNLNAGTSVTINTAGAGADAGDITVSAAIAKISGSTASLSLIADRNLTFNNHITSSGTGTGALSINLTAKTGNVSGSGNLGTNGGLLTLNSATAGALTGAITGSGGLTKTGEGAITLQGASTYTGATTVSAGTLVSTNMGSLRTSGIFIAAGATFEANVAAHTGYNGATTVSGAGTFKKTGVGGLQLSTNTGVSMKFANNAGGLIDIQAGSLQNDVRQASLKTNLADVNIESSALLDMRGETVQMRGLTGAGNIINTHNWENQLTIGVGAAAVSTSSYIGVIGANVGNASILKNTESGAITNATTSQSINLAKSGVGTQILTGTNIYTGTTTINDGTLQIGAGGSTGTLGANTRTITNNGNLTINRSNDFGIANVIIGTGSFTQAGTGTTTLTGANTYSGITTVSGGGTLQVGNGGGTGTLGTGDVTLANGANLNYKRNVTTTIANTMTGNGNVNADITGGDLTVSKAIDLSGGGNIYLKTTNGTMSTSAAMTGANITLDNTAGTMDVTTGAIVQGSGSSRGAAGISLGGALTATSNVNILGVNTATGTGNQFSHFGVDLKSSAAITAQNISITGASDNSFGLQQSTGALNATGDITINGTSKNWVGVVTNGAINAGGVLSITGKKTTNSGFQGVNIFSAVKGASVSITGESVNEKAVQIGVGKSVQATAGHVVINGTSGTSEGIAVGSNATPGGAVIVASGNVTFVGASGNATLGQSGQNGVRIWDGSTITAGNSSLPMPAIGSINITGTVHTQSGSSGNGVNFNRYPSAAKLTATGDISINGTVTGLGGGVGVVLNNASGGYSGQAPMMDAGGQFTLRGNNRASTSHTSAAINGPSGVQVTAGGDIVIQAETQNAASNAINFTSETTGQTGNASFTTTGNVLIQANQGGINFSNALPTNYVTGTYTAFTEIKGKNITIDNTGAGMAIGAVASGVPAVTGSGGTQGASIANGGSISSTGVITTGTGKSRYASGAAISLNSGAGLAITASENVNIAAVNDAGTQSALYTGSAVSINGKNVTLDGKSFNSNGVYTNGAITATGGDVNITGVSNGTGLSASALSLQGAITANQNVVIKGENTLSGNGNPVAQVFKMATATHGKIDITTSTKGVTPFALKVESGTNLSAKTAVNITTDTLDINTSATPAKVHVSNTGGTVTIKTDSTDAKIAIGAGDAGHTNPTSRTLGLSNAELNLITAGNLIIGDASNTGGITVSQATTTNATTGNVTLQTGGNIVVGAALTVGDDPSTTAVEASKKLALHAGGSVTQASGAAIKAAELQLKGLTTAANFTLSEKTNAVGKLAAVANKVEFTNASGLDIGEVDVLGLTTPVTTVSGITSAEGAAITTQAGDLTITKAISNSTSGDVVLGAGVGKLAGDGAGGDVKTTSFMTATNSGSGKTYIYTGSVAGTGLLSQLTNNLAELNLSSFGSAPSEKANTVSHVAYTTNHDAAISGASGGGTAQVFFRQAIGLGTVDFGVSTVNKTYGDVSKTYVDGLNLTADVRSQMKVTHASTETISIALTGAANSVKIKTADLIDALSIEPTTAFSAGSYSSSNHLKANTTGYGYTVAYTGSAYAVNLADTSAKVVVGKKTITTATIGAAGNTYGATVGAGAVDLGTDVVSGDWVSASSAVTKVDAAYSTSNSLKAGKYNQAVAAGLASGNDKSDADNYIFAGTSTGNTAATANYTVGKKTITTATIGAAGNTYGGTVGAGAVDLGTDVVSGDWVSASSAVTKVDAAYSTSNTLKAGKYNQAVAAGLASGNDKYDADNYIFAGTSTGNTAATANYTVDKKTITVGGLTVNNKSYDGTHVAAVTDGSSLSSVAAGASVSSDNKLVAGDNVSLTGTAVGTYDSKDVAATGNKVTFTGKALSKTVATGADDTSNYALVQQVQAMGDGTIQAKTVRLTGARDYDGTTAVAAADLAVFTGVSVNGKTEVLDLSGSGLIASKNVIATGGVVQTRQLSDKDTLALSNKAGDNTTTVDGLASNYVIDKSQSTVTIGKRNLTLAAVTDSKTYDGTTASSKSVNVSNKATTDTVTVSQSYTDKNVAGTGGSILKVNDAVTIVDGSNVDMSGNYALVKQTASGTIGKATLTLALADQTKVYDGTVDAVMAAGQVSAGGVTVGGQQESALFKAVSGRYNSKNVVDAATVSATVHASDVASTSNNLDLNNYTLSNNNATQVATGNGKITQANLTLTANSDSSRVYNGAEQSVSGFAITSGSLKGADTAALDLAGITAGGKRTDAGTTATTVNDSAYTNGNYAISKVDGTLSVAQKEVALAAAKAYDGSKTLTGTQLRITTGVGTETLGFSSASINSKDVKDNSGNYVDAVVLTDGTGKASNYTFTAARSANNTVALTQANLTLTANSDSSRVYNGEEQSVSGFAITSGSLKGTDTAAIDLAGITAGGKRTDAGTTATTVNDSAYTNGNYAISKVDGTLSVAQKEVALAAAKAYDGSKTLTGTQLRITTGVGTETLGFSSASINSKDVKDNSSNYVDAVVLTDGTGKASNYTFTAARSANNTVALTQANLTLTANSDNSRVYNSAEQSVSGFAITSGSLKGTDTAALDLAGITAGGKRTDAGTTATTVNDSAYTNGNYAISKVDGTLSVAQKEVALAAAKAYDGSKTLTGTQLRITTGVGTETLGFSSASINSKDVKDNSSNYVDAVVLTDGTGKASNYKFTAARSANNTVALTQATLTVTLADQTKTYDGTTAATLVPSAFTVKGVTLGGQTETAGVNQAVALYNDKHVLSATSVTVNLAAGIFAAATGTDLNNYNLPTSVIGKGTITPKDAAVTGTATTVQANGTQQTQSPATKSGFVSGEDVTVSGIAKGMIAGTYNSNLSAAPANAATVLSNYKIAYTNAALRITPAIVTNSNVVVDLALARTSMPTSRLNLSDLFNAGGVGAAMSHGVDSVSGSKVPTGAPVLPSQACLPESLQQCECNESGDYGIELCLAPDGKL